MFLKTSVQVTLFTSVLILELVASSTSNSLYNKEVTTYIDISSQLVKVKSQITVNNPSSKPIENYFYIVDPLMMHNVSYIEATDENKILLYVNKRIDDDFTLKYNILFKSPLMPGETKTFYVNSIIINYLVSYPKSVKQSEKHLVLFSFNVYYYSMYFTDKQTTYLHTGSFEVTYVDGAKYETPDSNSNYGLKYGPYFEIESMSEHPSVVHYENSAPFLAVQNLDRYIQISHWGYIKVWDQITIVHKGPTFKGPFERFKSGVHDSPDTRVESYVTSLPPNAFNIYLKDEIGLITVGFQVDNTHSHFTYVKVRPRFVLYGGWKTYYEIGYTLNISNYLGYHKDSYTLTMPMVDKIFSNMVIQQATINIILPEGAEAQEISPYVELENKTNNLYCYVLDVFCREVVTFKKFNLVEMHMQDVSLTYKFSQWLLLLKPFVIIVAFSVMFLTFILRMHIMFNDHNNVNTFGSVANEMLQQLEAKSVRNVSTKEETKKKLKKVKSKKS